MCEDTYAFEDVELMQFTGLHDKNGVEIYEVDIVRCEIYGEEYIGQVEYAENLCIYCLTGMGRSDSELWICNYIEVIGNIHDNPELLTEGDK